ncbi:hypothetical protein EDC04DRAFT_2598390 [Pisolithus marmoratus]|nr:hypothetical protein EDC04DRAFT_2598390 [Pisolithus marmoratus]
MASKEEKSMKMKELLFAPDNSNYLDFLCSILLKHGLTNYQVSNKKHFPLKQQLSNAINVDNQNDYKEMVKKISDNILPTVKVFIDMQHIKKLPHILQVTGTGSGNDSEPSTDGNMEDGQATINVPPNIPSFDIANKVPVLHPACKAPTHLLSPSVNINSLTLVLSLQMLTQSGLLIGHQEATTSSPPVPSPSQLACFLQYAETSLGVHYALSYKSALALHGIGLDILQDVDNKFLSDLGISAGNVIHLKKGSTAWWNGPDAKCKQSDTVTSTSAVETQEQPAKKCVLYEQYCDDNEAVAMCIDVIASLVDI